MNELRRRRSPTTKQIYAYLTAAVKLYGKISLAELLDIYNQENGPMDQEEFLSVALSLETENSPFVILNNQHIYCSDAQPCDWQVVAPVLAYATWDNLFTMETAQEGLPLCKLPKEQFLAYANPDSLPDTAQIREMLTYLTDQVTYAEGPERLLEEAILQAQEDNLADFCLHELQRIGAVFGRLEQRKNFAQLYEALSHTVRKPVFRGHTQEELEVYGIPRERVEQYHYAWFCPPSQRTQRISDKALMGNAAPCGNSLRGQLAARAVYHKELPPKLFEPCFCGSGLYYADCCGKR